MTPQAEQHAAGAEALLVQVDLHHDMAAFDALPAELRRQLRDHPSNIASPHTLRMTVTHGVAATVAAVRAMEADALDQWRRDNETWTYEGPGMIKEEDDDLTAEERAAAATNAPNAADAAAERQRIAALLRQLSDEHEMLAMWIEHGAKAEAWPLGRQATRLGAQHFSC